MTDSISPFDRPLTHKLFLISSTFRSFLSAPRQMFIVPKPNQGGANEHSLSGQTFVLTGVFPEVGGGSGLSQGKQKVKAMIQSFGMLFFE